MLSLQQAVPALMGGFSTGNDTPLHGGQPQGIHAPTGDPFPPESPASEFASPTDIAECPPPGFDLTNFDWTTVVAQIRDNDPEGMESLYNLFARGIRYYLCRQVGSQEIDDKVHDTIVIVVQAIRRGELREPDRLMGFVRTVVRRQVANHIAESVQVRKGQLELESGATVADLRTDPETNILSDERLELMKDVLGEISGRDREILRRFYLEEQTQEQICAEMNLNETQFRLLKWRAKQRFGEVGRQKLKSTESRAEKFMRKILRRAH